MRRGLLLLVMLAPAIALAWIPPGDFLVGKMADKRKTLKTVQINGIRTYIGKGFDGGKLDVAETIWAAPDGAYRIERKNPKGEYLEVSDGKKRVIVENGTPRPIEDDKRELDRILLVGGTQKDDLTRALEGFGVRIDTASLGRLDNRVAWIVGAKEGDVSSPQLWIDKDRWFPLVLDDPRTKMSVRYDGWGESAGSGQIPARITWKRGGTVTQELKVESVKTNPKLGADLFKPEAPIPPTPTPKASPTPKPAATSTAKPAPTKKPGG